MVGDHFGDCTYENALISSMVGDHSCGWTYAYALKYGKVGDRTYGWTYENVFSADDTWFIGFYPMVPNYLNLGSLVSIQWYLLLIKKFYENLGQNFLYTNLDKTPLSQICM